MAQLHLQLVTPQGQILKQSCDSILAPTEEGQISILPGHVRLISALNPGELIINAGLEKHYLHVDGGFIRVGSESQVIILADAAAHSKDLDEEHILSAKRRAEELLQQENLADEEYAKAAASLELNLSKLRTVRRHAHRSRHPITSEGVLND